MSGAFGHAVQHGLTVVVQLIVYSAKTVLNPGDKRLDEVLVGDRTIIELPVPRLATEEKLQTRSRVSFS
jgi:hypothetical protein